MRWSGPFFMLLFFAALEKDLFFMVKYLEFL